MPRIWILSCTHRVEDDPKVRLEAPWGGLAIMCPTCKLPKDIRGKEDE